MRPIAPFTPIPLSHDLVITSEGIRRIGPKGQPLHKLHFYSSADFDEVIPLIAIRVATAVARLLPNELPNGGEAWEVVEAAMSSLRHGEAMERENPTVPLLYAARLLAGDRPERDDERVLCVFVELLLPNVLANDHSGVSSVVNARAPRRGNTVIPWPGILGADIHPPSTLADALSLFDSDAFTVDGDRVCVVARVRGMPLDVTIALSEALALEAADMLRAAQAVAGQGPFEKTTEISSVVVPTPFGRFKAVARLNADRTTTWAFNRMVIPKAVKRDYGFDVT